MIWPEISFSQMLFNKYTLEDWHFEPKNGGLMEDDFAFQLGDL